MTDDQPYLPRRGMDERAIARVMIRDKFSEHWEACSNFVNHCVNAKAKNIPFDYHEDIAQEVMHKIKNGLPGFRFESTLKSWVNVIIDVRRRLRKEEITHVPLTDQTNESDREGEGFTRDEEKSAEDAFMINDKIRGGWAALLEYVHTHANPIRNQLIIRMVIYEGRTYAEAAKVAGCTEPVVGYVVREAQRYARENGH
jgi:DNA-directed RNA polymerase specialized sigma24 family protein